MSLLGLLVITRWNDI